MKVTVLGNNGPYPSAGGACSGYLIQSGNTSILNDIGPGSLANLFKVMNPADLNAIVLSHLHYDHISDLYSLGYYFSINKKVMDLFLPDHPRDIYEQFKNNKAFNVFPICDCNMFHIKEITLTFCEMTHPLKSYASKYRDNVSTFVYSGDTNYNERLGEFGRKCDLLIVDGGNAAPHLFPEDCDVIEKQAQARRIMISHLNPSFDNEHLFSQPLVKTGDVYQLG